MEDVLKEVEDTARKTMTEYSEGFIQGMTLGSSLSLKSEQFQDGFIRGVLAAIKLIKEEVQCETR